MDGTRERDDEAEDVEEAAAVEDESEGEGDEDEEDEDEEGREDEAEGADGDADRPEDSEVEAITDEAAAAAAAGSSSTARPAARRLAPSEMALRTAVAAASTASGLPVMVTDRCMLPTARERGEMRMTAAEVARMRRMTEPALPMSEPASVFDTCNTRGRTGAAVAAAAREAR